ncbi:hypothetical protein [Shewanella woodyi]|uniref:hypothetical protein n=1 Tax=Shewanella woodyi TaxID=60961 RepID=UPI00374A9045
MINDLIQAINNRQEISFIYSGLQRVVQPAAVGVSTAGNEVLRCFQIEGKHITPEHEWDLCTVSKISSFKVTGRMFEVDPRGYKRGDKGMIKIHAQL